LDLRVDVPLVERGVGRETVEVFGPVHIPDPATFTAFQDDIQRVIIMSAVALLEIDIFLTAHRLVL
jgi:hypothetical protein